MIEFLVAVGLALVVGFGIGFYVGAYGLGERVARDIRADIKRGRYTDDDVRAALDRREHT